MLSYAASIGRRTKDMLSHGAGICLHGCRVAAIALSILIIFKTLSQATSCRRPNEGLMIVVLVRFLASAVFNVFFYFVETIMATPPRSIRLAYRAARWPLAEYAILRLCRADYLRGDRPICAACLTTRKASARLSSADPLADQREGNSRYRKLSHPLVYGPQFCRSFLPRDFVSLDAALGSTAGNSVQHFQARHSFRPELEIHSHVLWLAADHGRHNAAAGPVP